MTKEELEVRRHFIGASEVAAIVGIDPRKAPIDVWRAKVEPPVEVDNRFTRWGKRLEEAIAQEYRDRNGYDVLTCDPRVHPESKVLRATPDRLVFVGQTESPKKVLEVKTGDARTAHRWGGSGDPQGVPDFYVIQVTVQMDVFELHSADVAVLLGGNDYRQYPVPWDEDMAGRLREAAEKFWRDYVVTRKPPPVDASKGWSQYLKAKFRQKSEEMLPASTEAQLTAITLRNLRERIKSDEEQATLVENRLKVMIGSAAGIEGICTWKTDAKGRPDWKAIAEELGVTQKLIDKHEEKPVRRFLLKP